ncbi:4-hydroxybutyrate CoA-transferase [Clostridium tetanomorphum]|uniref:CGGC domain-containing protein n=1 Tax=Clostridium tetanomorphum TaxID=1553 RepID=A0A923E5W6_CLOTT|nr:hypothetical protein [Clostridium tetanomorphum]KAJ52010.1 hypothetical protein CTM_09566 [Clostridium tetanomorphum DSM 665]MBC2397020.1 hypothetical protein [Clostridium tetanomorphum]MBP1862930.1 4-hydroxybutyrate CoA-transferase [Clostridium tetanomorphum]NRS87067.1 4-hydroxybutyrate CoA-transferase [Clostridium tetanomorphum]NRZ99138.1 4-hydroxybutyrate CoA-transferase [Clostridium tetanomorphum]
MKVGIKYCGGCNPKYDRTNIVTKLTKQYDNLIINLAKEDEIYDFIIVLCGCTSCCAKDENLKSKYGKIFVSSENDYYKISKFLDGIDK